MRLRHPELLRHRMILRLRVLLRLRTFLRLRRLLGHHTILPQHRKRQQQHGCPQEGFQSVLIFKHKKVSAVNNGDW